MVQDTQKPVGPGEGKQGRFQQQESTDKQQVFLFADRGSVGRPPEYLDYETHRQSGWPTAPQLE